MDEATIRVRIGGAVFVAGLCFSLLVEAATVTVDCDAGSTIAGALNSLKPGDTLLVSGTCKEQVTVSAEIQRITLDGQKKSTIQFTGSTETPGSVAHAVYIRGKEITIKGFTVTGGRDGIHLSGPASAVIDGNVIINNAQRGIHIDKGSVAQIINNTIQNNRSAGINVAENSYARIGFFIPPNPTLAPNTVQNNGGHGINVERASSAWIVGNTISNNKGSGIALNRSSQADIVANVIDANGGDAITASHNTGVNLRSEASPRGEGPNQTTSTLKNGGVGIRCVIGGYVEGPPGTLAGTQGTKEFDSTCVDRVAVP
jgi:parallel beta-helix repeat protein